LEPVAQVRLITLMLQVQMLEKVQQDLVTLQQVVELLLVIIIKLDMSVQMAEVVELIIVETL
jgi:hypothetical protein